MKKFVFGVLALVAVLSQRGDAVSLNSRGQVAQGVGGAGAFVDNQPIASGNSGGTAWIDDDDVVFQSCDGGCRLLAYNVTTKTTRVEASKGANFISAGGGVWAAWLGGFGVYSSDGVRDFPNSGLGPMGPDGALALKVAYFSYGPWDVVEKDGSRWRLTDGDAYDIQLLGQHRAVFHDIAGIHAIGLPQPVTLTPTIYWFRTVFVGGQPWALYQAAEAGGRLVLHPYNSLTGYAVSSGGNAYRPDAVQLGAKIRVAYATREDEAPGTVVVADLDPGAPRVDLRTFLVPAPAPVPPPVPPPIVTPPPPPPAPPQEPASLIDDVRALRAGYPSTLSPAQLGELLNRVAWKNRAAGWGLLAKPGGNNCPAPSGVLVGCDILFHKPSGLHYDVLGAAGDPGGSIPSWSADGPMDVSRWVASTDPGGASAPAPTPTPTPAPDQTAALRAQIDGLQQQLAYMTQHAKDLDQQVADVQALQHQAEAARDQAQAALAAERAKPVPTGGTCSVNMPAVARILGIHCTVNK